MTVARRKLLILLTSVNLFNLTNAVKTKVKQLHIKYQTDFALTVPVFLKAIKLWLNDTMQVQTNIPTDRVQCDVLTRTAAFALTANSQIYGLLDHWPCNTICRSNVDIARVSIVSRTMEY